MKENTACINLEDLSRLYSDRERLTVANETLYQIAGIIRDHIAVSNYWSHDIAGYKISDGFEVLELIIKVLQISQPGVKAMLKMEQDRQEAEAASAAEAYKAQRESEEDE